MDSVGRVISRTLDNGFLVFEFFLVLQLWIVIRGRCIRTINILLPGFSRHIG